MKSTCSIQFILGVFVGILLICSGSGSLLGYTQAFSDAGNDPKLLVRITTTNSVYDLPSDAEVISEQSGRWVDVILPSSKLGELTKNQKDYSILLGDVEQYSRSVAGSYHTLAEMEAILQSIAETYPEITRLKTIGTTYEGRSIWCLEITDNPGVDEGEPGVYFMGVHHAREWPTLEICLYIAQQLTEAYGSDPAITDLVNSRRIWVTPCMNPDGYYYCHDQGHDWRKNRHFYPEYGTYGVDLNRNYAGSCNGDIDGAWGSVGNGGASHLPSSEVYCGQWAFSENETQAIRNMFLENSISASITWHNYGEVVIAPWSYTSGPAPDNDYLMDVAQQIASRITKDSGNGTYFAEHTGGTTGDMTDWTYGYSLFEQGKPSFAYTIESCSEFQPPATKLDQIVSENFKGALYLLQEAENISTVVPRVLPPEIQEMSWDADGNYSVSWDEQNPAAGADAFQLDELTGLSLWQDDAESNRSLWILDGFTMNASRSHSAEQSYMPRNKSKDVSSLTSVYPIPVTEGMNLSFWCWYSIEKNKDFAMVEVSRDGRSYDLLDTFTGYLGNWTLKTYSLDTYVGDSVFIRFRYTTDDRKTLAGFFVDDIAPVVSVSHVATLSDSITGTSYHIQGKTNGTYMYRVRGHNTVRGWGDFSSLQKITVGNTSLTVDIRSPQQHYIYLKNRRILPFFATIAIGVLDVKVNVSDPSQVQHVEFYLDNKLQHATFYLPYNWTWNTFSFFRHTLKVVAVDSFGKSVSDDIRVWKFF
jgi:murein tripeptide amidase MpaA